MLVPDLSEFDAIVYDLDGTLVDLRVDWDGAMAEMASALQDAGVDTRSMGVWSMVDHASHVGLGERVERILDGYERAGALKSKCLPAVDVLQSDGVSSGVCSLNSEGACWTALDVHDLDDHVDAVVGRDTVAARKPDPEPLLATLDRMGVGTESAVFVGDSYRDELTARRAGVAYRYVGWRSIGVLDTVVKTLLGQER
ncbi:HAD family hydrolase [Haloferax namakaokahaiae]|uniref:HAD family hydrolase n=1 Tax=Haloferax namakaokahaiae TaxID=1748331 RepID=A0ABD5ZA20_9EURY